MNRLDKIKSNAVFAISETSIELNKYLKDVINIQHIPTKKVDNLVVFVLLLYVNHDFDITISNQYVAQDHKFFGSKIDYPCTTVFIHSSIDDFEKNM